MGLPAIINSTFLTAVAPFIERREERAETLCNLESFLQSRIFGQQEAIQKVSEALLGAEFELNEIGLRPKASFLFMGPTGVGKTETAKRFTGHLFDEAKLEMFFMNEYQDSFKISELIDRLQEGINRNPGGTTLLFDEVEKAHPKINDLFLSMLDEGQVTLDASRRISVCHCYIVMTSNLGSKTFPQMENTKYQTLQDFALAEARKHLRPELVARLTETIVYRPLKQETQIRILNSLILKKIAHLERVMQMQIRIDEQPVYAHLLRVGFNITGGARFIRQEVDRQLNGAVLPWLLARQSNGRGVIKYNSAAGKLVME
jgi:ATP-dependent Clp protease ATP-binding subunit ClpA